MSNFNSVIILFETTETVENINKACAINIEPKIICFPHYWPSDFIIISLDINLYIYMQLVDN